MADDRQIADIWRTQYTGPLFRKYAGLEQVPEASIGYLARQSRLAVDFCQTMMRPLGLQQYAVNTPLSLPSGETGVMRTHVIAGFGGTPIVTTRVELERKIGKEEKEEKEEEEEIYLGLFVWSKEVEIDGEKVRKAYCLEPNPAITVNGTRLGVEPGEDPDAFGTWRLFELDDVPPVTKGTIAYSYPTSGGVTTLIDLAPPDAEQYELELYVNGETEPRPMGDRLLDPNESSFYVIRDGQLVAVESNFIGFNLFNPRVDADGNEVEISEGTDTSRQFLLNRSEIIDDTVIAEKSDSFSITPDGSVHSFVYDIDNIDEDFIYVSNTYYGPWPIKLTVEEDGSTWSWSGGGSSRVFNQLWGYVSSPFIYGYRYVGFYDYLVPKYEVGDIWQEWFLRFPEDSWGDTTYSDMRDLGRARKISEHTEVRLGEGQHRVYDALGLIGIDTAGITTTAREYDSNGYPSGNADYSYDYPTYETIKWNNQLIDIRCGEVPCKDDPCVYKTYFLFDLAHCTLDGAAVLMEVELSEYYDEDPYREGYAVKYFGLYDGVVTELTELFDKTSVVTPFRYKDSGDGYDSMYINDHVVLYSREFGRTYVNHIFYMALQRPYAKP